MTDPDRSPVERETVVVTDRGSGGGGSGAIIAVVLLLIVVVVGYVLYRNGVFSGLIGGDHDININLKTDGGSAK